MWNENVILPICRSVLYILDSWSQLNVSSTHIESLKGLMGLITLGAVLDTCRRTDGLGLHGLCALQPVTCKSSKGEKAVQHALSA